MINFGLRTMATTSSTNNVTSKSPLLPHRGVCKLIHDALQKLKFSVHILGVQRLTQVELLGDGD